MCREALALFISTSPLLKARGLIFGYLYHPMLLSDPFLLCIQNLPCRSLTLTLWPLSSLRSSDLGDFSEDDEEDADELLVTDSPEPPEPVEPEDMLQTDNCQPGRLHPEQDLPHVFKVSATQVISSASLYFS